MKVGPPAWVIWLLVAMVGLALFVLGAVFFQNRSGLATLDGQQRQQAQTECAREVAVRYEEARDDLLIAPDRAAGIEAQDRLRALYYPQGPDGPKVTRAELTEQECG